MCKTIYKSLCFFSPPIVRGTDLNVFALYFKMFSFKWSLWAFGIKQRRERRKAALTGGGRKKERKKETLQGQSINDNFSSDLTVSLF